MRAARVSSTVAGRVRGHRGAGIERAGRAGERARFNQGSHAFLEEERIAFGPGGELPLERRELEGPAEQVVEQLVGGPLRERIHPELGVERLAGPSMPILGAVRDDDQDASRRHDADEGVDGHLGIGVDPVRVLQDDDQGPREALPDDDAPERIEHAASPLRRLELRPVGIGDLDLQERAERREQGFFEVQLAEPGGQRSTDLGAGIAAFDAEEETEQRSRRPAARRVVARQHRDAEHTRGPRIERPGELE